MIVRGRVIDVRAALVDMGDPQHLLPHTRTEFLLASFPRVTPSPQVKGRRKGTRRQRKAARS